MIFCRKRTRSVHDETEFMPLSKRINNLHINNLLLESQNQFSNSAWCQPNGAFTSHNNQIPVSPCESEQSTEGGYLPYSPDLTESQNPHYFNINKLLYEVYMERVRRGCN